MTTGEQIRELREMVGLTQAEFAKKLGLTQSALSQIEARNSAGMSTLRRFGSKFGYTYEGQFVEKKK